MDVKIIAVLETATMGSSCLTTFSLVVLLFGLDDKEGPALVRVWEKEDFKGKLNFFNI